MNVCVRERGERGRRGGGGGCVRLHPSGWIRGTDIVVLERINSRQAGLDVCLLRELLSIISLPVLTD